MTELELRQIMAGQGRYPLYGEGGGEVVATIDEDLRLRDTAGRFIPDWVSTYVARLCYDEGRRKRGRATRKRPRP